MPPDCIRTRNPSKRAAADPRLRRCGHWARLMNIYIYLYNIKKICLCVCVWGGEIRRTLWNTINWLRIRSNDGLLMIFGFPYKVFKFTEQLCNYQNFNTMGAETTTGLQIEQASLNRRKTVKWYETTNRRCDVIEQATCSKFRRGLQYNFLWSRPL